MKQVLSKLIKSYDIYLDQYFKIDGFDKLENIKEEVFYSSGFYYPTQIISPNTTVDIPLELFDIHKKNLKLVYTVKAIDHENKKIKTELSQIKTIYYHGGVSNPAFNINVLIKDEYYVVLKVLLSHKVKNIVCSKKRIIEIRKACAEAFKKCYNRDISKIILDICNKEFTQTIISNIFTNVEFIKGIIVTKFIS